MTPLRVARGWRRLGIRAFNEASRILHSHGGGKTLLRFKHGRHEIGMPAQCKDHKCESVSRQFQPGGSSRGTFANLRLKLLVSRCGISGGDGAGPQPPHN